MKIYCGNTRVNLEEGRIDHKKNVSFYRFLKNQLKGTGYKLSGGSYWERDRIIFVGIDTGTVSDQIIGKKIRDKILGFEGQLVVNGANIL